MANSNGAGVMVKALLAVLILSLAALGTLVVMGADSLNVHMDRVEDKVDIVEDKQIAYDKQQARTVLQQAEFARALSTLTRSPVAVVVDTVAANGILNGDSL